MSLDKYSHNYGEHSASQKDRFPEMILPSYFSLDERSFSDMLLYLKNFAHYIKFYNLENKVVGNWSALLLDEAILIAEIQSVDPKKFELDFKKKLEHFQLRRKLSLKKEDLKDCFQELFKIAQLIDHWISEFRKVEKYALVQLEIRDELISLVDEKLSERLLYLKLIEERLGQVEGLDYTSSIDYNKLSAFWELPSIEVRLTDVEDGSPEAQINHLARLLEKDVFQAFYEGLIYLKNRASYYFQLSLEKNIHYPEIALIFSFLHLFEHLQKKFNGINQKYLDFYYRQVLHQKIQETVPDQVYITYSTLTDWPFALVKKGERFHAGEYPNGENIIYESNYDLEVSQARIQQVNSLFLEKGDYWLSSEQKLSVGNIFATQTDIENLQPDESKREKKPYPSFGESQKNKGLKDKTMEKAHIGFAISSPVLFLKEGEREISIDLVCSNDSYTKFIEILEEIAGEEKDKLHEFYNKFFLEAFQLYITGDSGWFPIDYYSVKDINHHDESPESSDEASTSDPDATTDTNKRTLRIIFGLRSSNPSWVAYDSNVHGQGFDDKYPILKIILNNESFLYPYSLLKNLVIEDILIHVKANKLKDLQLYNQVGPLNSSNPFFPFGPIPSIGSYLIIGNSEAFFKTLDTLHVRIQWYNLPRSSGGFKSYYEGYNMPYGNDAFEVRLSILQDGIWQPEEDGQQIFQLFQSVSPSKNGQEPPENAPLQSFTIFDEIDIFKLKAPPEFNKVNSPIEYDHLSLQGFIKLELCNPHFAFGHSIYQGVLSKAMMENAQSSILQRMRKGLGSKEESPLPNQPFSPQIKSLEIDYASSSSIQMNGSAHVNHKNGSLGKYYHIQAFGNAQVFPNDSGESLSLLPFYQFEGFMAIGLDQLDLPQQTSLLFEMFNDYAESSEQSSPEVSWYYLSNDTWYAIPDTKIIRDDTQNFINSGIVVIELPGEMNKGNQILHSEYYWLGIAINRNISNVAKLLSISTQVNTATLINLNEKFDHLDNPLDPFSIKRSVQSISGIQNVEQPLPSFNGKPRESKQHFYTRVSERLRHKQRASSSWDYERLILEKFSEIQKVICLTDLAGSYGYKPGSIVLVVIPKEHKDAIGNTWERRVSNQLLLDIKTYLTKYISPHVRLEVRNPHYEKVKILCSIMFDQKHSFGYYLIQLNRHLNEFLTEDILGSQMGEELGGKIHSTDVLSYIRSLDYVKFATQFSMIQISKGIDGRYKRIDTAREINIDNIDEIKIKSYLEAQHPWSKLIPTQKHYFTELKVETEIRPSQAGIDTLGLDEEFIIDD